MRYRLIHPNGESTEHPRILFLQEHDGYLSAIYEHVSIRTGVTRLWLVSSSYDPGDDDGTNVFTIKSCEYGVAPNATDDDIARYSGNLVAHVDQTV